MKIAPAPLCLSLLCLGLISLPARGQALEKQIRIEETDTYLNFPIAQSNEMTKVRLLVDGEVMDESTLRLAEEEPDYWTFLDVSLLRGKTITLQVDDGQRAVDELTLVDADSTFPGKDVLYREKYRPQVTFSSRRGWHNDPNGLVYHDGTYHLYYQHNPYGREWGNMHWGHAVSTDLVHWKELPDALYMPQHEHMAFSGSAVVDAANTSGLRRDGVDPIVAFYTRTGRGESMALSYDGGLTFEEYEGNPLVPHNGRDPKVFWYEPGGHWVMVVYDESKTRANAAGGETTLYQFDIHTSPNLTDWTYQSSIPGFFECPELFEIEVEGRPGVTKWVMYDASGEYLVGDFDGKVFTPEQPFRKFDYGGRFYASQLYNNIPEEDGRTIQIGWFTGGHFEGMPFSQKMTFPTSLALRESFDGLRLTPTPVEEIASLHEQTHVYTGQVVTGEQSFVPPVSGDVLHVIAEIDPGDAPSVGLDVNGYRITYDAFRNTLNGANYVLSDPSSLTIEVIIDRVSVEAFVNGGEMYLVDAHNSVDANRKIEVFATGGHEREAVLKSLTVHELGSIWAQSAQAAGSE